MSQLDRYSISPTAYTSSLKRMLMARKSIPIASSYQLEGTKSAFYCRAGASSIHNCLRECEKACADWDQADSLSDRVRSRQPSREESSDVEARAPTVGSESQAPIKLVDGHPWSPGVYRSQRLVGQDP